MPFIIGRKRSAYPVPGVQFNGRKLFIEILPADNEKDVVACASFVSNALRDWADRTKGVKYTKKVNTEALGRLQIEDN